MALPSSGTISLSMIATEFGAITPPYSVSDFYRGGLFVPNASINNGIPTYGTISLSMFYGASNQIESNTTISTDTTDLLITPDTIVDYEEGITVVNLVIDAVVYASTTSDYGLKIQNFHQDDIINLTITENGKIVGKGGEGGRGGYTTGNDSSCSNIATNRYADGEDGGDALYIRNNVNIVNNGIIGGGGGGGGGGNCRGQEGDSSYVEFVGGGGGGGGASYGTGGIKGYGWQATTESTAGDNGGVTSGGNGGNGGRHGDYIGCDGGNGGDLGQDGEDGEWKFYSDRDNERYGFKGLAGKAVDGNSYITWSTLGDVRGSRIN